jgi:hypothetical protein
MPIRTDPSGDHVDVELAHDLLRAIPIPEGQSNEVYFVATNRPLQLHAPTPGTTAILLDRSAPNYLATWMITFQDNIERGTVQAPSDWVPRLESAGLIFIAIGKTFFGVPSAQAATTACG